MHSVAAVEVLYPKDVASVVLLRDGPEDVVTLVGLVLHEHYGHALGYEGVDVLGRVVAYVPVRLGVAAHGKPKRVHDHRLGLYDLRELVELGE
jgi:hypothetical protein